MSMFKETHDYLHGVSKHKKDERNHDRIRQWSFFDKLTQNCHPHDHL
jgi:hypothetical protein